MRRVSLAAILAAVGLAIVYLLGAGHSTSRSATTMHSPTAAAQASADALGAPPGGGPHRREGAPPAPIAFRISSPAGR